MKVVLFCGGLGTRLREHSETIPKPLVPIGKRPIIWHLMKFYAHHGHKDFILCLGYKGEQIKEFFFNYDANVSRDCLLKGNQTEPSESDIADWSIQFVETGLHNNIGQRLLAVREHIAEEKWFLANYSDQLSDLPLNDYVSACTHSDALASFVSVRPSHSFHCVESDLAQHVTAITDVREGDLWINGGYLTLNQKVFDYLNEGEELVEEPFQRLLQEGKLRTDKYHGFWKAMDTFKDKIQFDRLDGRGETPWKVWS